jgi:predicted RNA-binding protein with PUA-like domain
MWLLKTEPGDYSWAQLEKAGRARWDGVRNPAAIRNLAAMKAGDRVFVYHTGDEKAVVGVAEVVKPAYPDPKYPDGKLNGRGHRGAREARPASHARGDQGARRVQGQPLVRMGRLSVVPLTAAQWKAIETRGKA